MPGVPRVAVATCLLARGVFADRVPRRERSLAVGVFADRVPRRERSLAVGAQGRIPVHGAAPEAAGLDLPGAAAGESAAALAGLADGGGGRAQGLRT